MHERPGAAISFLVVCAPHSFSCPATSWIKHDVLLSQACMCLVIVVYETYSTSQRCAVTPNTRLR